MICNNLIVSGISKHNKNIKSFVIKGVFLITIVNATYGAEKLEDIQLERRQNFEKSLDQIKAEVYTVRLPLIQNKYNTFKPNIFISYAWDEKIKPWVDQVLSKDLSRIGFEALYDQQGIMAGGKISSFEEKVSYATYAVVLCTPQYLKRYRDHDLSDPSKHTGVGREMERIVQRNKTDGLQGTVLPVYKNGDFMASVPAKLHKIAAFSMNDEESYYNSFFILCQNFFLFEHNDAEPIRSIRERFLRNNVRQQEKSTVMKLENLSLSHKDADEQYNTGIMYYKGQGVTKNYKESFKLFTAAAKQGQPAAQNILGYMHEHGEGVMKDEKEAFKWYFAAAQKEYLAAQHNLALLYQEGRGVMKDEKEAFKWYSAAAQKGYEVSQTNLGFLYLNGEGVTKNEKEAFKWLLTAAKNKDLAAQTTVGTLYIQGIGVTKNEKEAFKWTITAAQREDSQAQFNLGLMYEEGIGTTKNEEEAFKWYYSAAQKGYSTAQQQIGFMYLTGQGVTKNEKESLKWYTSAAKQGNIESQYMVGAQYYDKNEEEAFKWFTYAANNGHIKAQFNLGLMYEEGIGTTKNEKEALKWYTSAAQQGDNNAQNSLKKLGHVIKN